MPRFTIDVGAGSDLDKQLNKLQKEGDVTKAEIIRRAISVYALLKDEMTDDHKIAVVDSENRVVVKVAIP